MKRSKGEPPKVTGLSPKEGPPGTKLTIRGENLGINAKDIVGLIICNVNCTLMAEWISPSKIICRTTNCKGLGDVIVATRSGGIGSCTVKFRGTSILPNPLHESAIWVDESSFFERPLKNMSRPTSPMQGTSHDPLGLAETSPLDPMRDPIEDLPMSDEELQAMFPGCSSNLAHRNFEPLLYLIENHSATSFQDLKKGLIYLEKHSTLKAEGPQTFIKSNLGTFMNCQDILAAIHESLQTHENLGDPLPNSKPNGQGDGQEGDGENDEKKTAEFTLQKIENSLTRCNENAQQIFKSVLHRKDRADSTRNALNVLNRFKFLFHLPVNIERNIKRADYEVVINDYERARQLFSDTEVPVFKKVYKEVENMIDGLRVQLEKKLMELPLALEDQRKLIRYLVELEAPGDPAWKCIDNQQQWQLKLLLKCKKEHLQIDQKFNQPDSMGSSLRPHKGHARTHSGSQFKLITPDAAVVDVSPPQRVLYLEELVDILQLTFTDMWKLGQSYFSASIVAEAGGKNMTVDETKKEVFEQRITEVTLLFSNLIRAAFLPKTLNNMPKEKRLECGMWSDFQSESPGAWLPQCVRNTRSILSSFTVLDVPTSALTHIKSLVMDLRVQCLTVLFKEATEDIRCLYGRETWSLQMDDHGGITTLPLLFESIVIDTLQHLKEVVTFPKNQENENIFSDFDVTRQSVELASDMLKAFAQCLDQLAFQPKTEADTNQRLHLTEAVQRAPESIFQKGEDSLPSMEQCLVIVLSNCSHVSEHITPNLIDQFKSHGYPKMLEVENNVLDAYAELDEKIFEAYCEQKTDPLVGALEPGMYEGHFDWGDCPKPSGVRAYVKEAIMIAIAIHAEVHAIAPAFMPRVMAQVLEAIADEMARLMSCVTNFSSSGALQARLELVAIEEALNPYCNAGSSTSFQEAVQLVPALSASDKGLLQDLLRKFQNDMRFQLLCFTTDLSVH